MSDLIKILIEGEIANDEAEAIEIINCMKQEVEGGEDIQDVLLLYDLDLDSVIDLLLS